MRIEDFIAKFAEQLEDIDIDVDKLSASTIFRELNGWSSLIALSVLAMIDEEYDVQLKGEEIKNAKTIQQLFDLVQSKL